MNAPMVHPEAYAYAETVSAQTRAVRESLRQELGVPYGPDERHVLDIYLPAGEISGVPVLLFLHGGAWRNGSKDWMGGLAPVIVDLPAILVCPSYRLAPRNPFPAALHDVLDALDWVYRNIGARGGDPQRIALGGHSAGGHLAALATLRPELVVARGLPEDIVKACFPLSAPFDLRDVGRDDPAYPVIYGEFLGNPDDAAAASPLAFAGNARQPFLVAYGERDLPRVVAQGARMIEALSRRSAAPVGHLVLSGASHFDTHAQSGAPSHPWTCQVRRFLSLPEGACWQRQTKS